MASTALELPEQAGPIVQFPGGAAPAWISFLAVLKQVRVSDALMLALATGGVDSMLALGHIAPDEDGVETFI